MYRARARSNSVSSLPIVSDKKAAPLSQDDSVLANNKYARGIMLRTVIDSTLQQLNDALDVSVNYWLDLAHGGSSFRQRARVWKSKPEFSHMAQDLFVANMRAQVFSYEHAHPIKKLFLWLFNIGEVVWKKQWLLHSDTADAVRGLSNAKTNSSRFVIGILLNLRTLANEFKFSFCNAEKKLWLLGSGQPMKNFIPPVQPVDFSWNKDFKNPSASNSPFMAQVNQLREAQARQARLSDEFLNAAAMLDLKIDRHGKRLCSLEDTLRTHGIEADESSTTPLMATPR